MLTGLPVDTPEQIKIVASAIRELGAQNVVISLGKHGALLQSSEVAWFARSPQIEQKNPIGAGDSMLGSLLSALNKGLDLKGALG